VPNGHKAQGINVIADSFVDLDLDVDMDVDLDRYLPA
jgi:hypothetical protein